MDNVADALARARECAARADADGTQSALREAEGACGSDARAWRDLGQLHAELSRWDDAARALERALAIDPRIEGAGALLGIVRHERGDDAGALQALEASARVRPGDLGITLGRLLYLPQVYESAAEVARWRARYAAGIALAESELPRWRPDARQVFALNRTNFLLAYQGEDDRELQRRYSRILGTLATDAHPQWREPRAPNFDGGRRLRVGFAGAIFRECTAGRYFERWITGLDPRRFEVVVYHTAPVTDELTRRISAAAEAFVTLRELGEAGVARIAADDLDVLVQPEVGMTPFSYLLAALRIARVQVAGWGHPVTTGAEGVDAYATCAAMEPDDGASHYTERLVALPGLGASYPMPGPGPGLTRAQLRLPDERRLYACPQSLFKIHPEMDDVFARIIAADPAGVLLFFHAPARAVTDRFAARLQRALQARGMAPSGQIKFLPRMNEAGFRAALGLADVVVDTTRWSGGNTSLDALAAGTPVVTLPGRFMRARQTAAMLRMVGLDELVVASPEALVALAVDIAGSTDRNRHLRERIARNRAALFEQQAPLAALSEALLALGAGL